MRRSNLHRRWVPLLALLAVGLAGCPKWLLPPPRTTPAFVPAVPLPSPTVPAPRPQPEAGVAPGPESGGRVVLERLPEVTTDNRNSLIVKHRQRLTFAASSTWPGYPEAQAVDDMVKTSWFSGAKDSAALGKTP